MKAQMVNSSMKHELFLSSEVLVYPPRNPSERKCLALPSRKRTLSSVQQVLLPSPSHEKSNVNNGSRSISLERYDYNAIASIVNRKNKTAKTLNLPTAYSLRGTKISHLTCKLRKLFGPWYHLVLFQTPILPSICCNNWFISLDVVVHRSKSQIQIFTKWTLPAISLSASSVVIKWARLFSL